MEYHPALFRQRDGLQCGAVSSVDDCEAISPRECKALWRRKMSDDNTVTGSVESSNEETADSSDRTLSGILDRLKNRINEATTATLIVSSVMAVIIGIMAAWDTLNLFGIAPIAFIVVGAVAWRNMMHESNGWLAGGKSLYIMAIETFILPILFYLPVLFRTSDAESARAAGAFIGSLLGIFIWGFVCTFIAVILAGGGFLLRRKGGRSIRSEEPSDG